MDEIVVTRLWMAGVVGMMAVFAIIAVVGYLRNKPEDSSERNQNQQAPRS